MPTYANASIVWRRIQTDVARLSDAVTRFGSPETQQALVRAIETLNALTPYFDAPMLTLPKSTSPIPAQLTEKQIAGMAKVFADGQHAKKLGMGKDCNPYDSDHPIMRKAWFDGWSAANVEPELP